jgi:predicted DNA-binding ribbon-helix-helix protein
LRNKEKLDKYLITKTLTISNEAVMSVTKFLATVKDYRKARGKRYNLSSVLRLVLAGLLCGTNNLATIHRWAKTLGKQALINLGFHKDKLLCYSDLTVILRQADFAISLKGNEANETFKLPWI